MQTFKHLLGGVIVAIIALASCAKNETVTTATDELTTTDGSTRYMSVTMTMGTGTKASTYEIGSDAENSVTLGNCGFLFYDEDGSYVTYGELTTDSFTSQESGAIEDISDATVILGPSLLSPTYVLVVFNYPDWKNLMGYTYEYVQSVIYASTPNTSTDGSFTMASAGQLDTENTDSPYTNLTDVSEYIKTDKSEAEGSPVTLYVERQVAKVTISPQATQTSGDTYILGDSNDGYYADLKDGVTYIDYDSGSGKITTSDVPVRININGWTVNVTNSESYLVKAYDSEYVTSDFADEISSDFSSYLWAKDINYDYTEEDPDTTGITYLTYGKISECSIDAIYTHENTVNSTGQSATSANTSGYTAITPTVVVAAAVTLDVDKNGTDYEVPATTDGTTADLYINGGIIFSKDGITATALEEITSSYKTSDDNGSTFRTLTPDDVDVTYTAYTGSGATTNSGVYVVSSVDVGSTTIYTSTDGSNYTEATDASSSLVTALNNTSFLAVGTNSTTGATTGLKYYNAGKCYYQAVIEHTAGESTLKGIVRNHSYQITLNTISGIGGPVTGDDDSLEVIPGEDNEVNFLAAEINILSWISQSQTVDF